MCVLGARIESHLEGNLISNSDRTASGHIKQLLIKILAPIVKSIRNPPDNLEEYKQEYGYLGISLHGAVIKARTQPTPVSTLSSSSVSTNTITSVGQTIARTVSTSGIIQQGNPQARTIVMSQQTQRIAVQQSQQQKVVFMPQRSQPNQQFGQSNAPTATVSHLIQLIIF